MIPTDARAPDAIGPTPFGKADACKGQLANHLRRLAEAMPLCGREQEVAKLVQDGEPITCLQSITYGQYARPSGAHYYSAINRKVGSGR